MKGFTAANNLYLKLLQTPSKDITRKWQTNYLLCKNLQQSTSKLNSTVLLKELHTTTNWDLSQECKNSSTQENQYNQTLIEQKGKKNTWLSQQTQKKHFTKSKTFSWEKTFSKLAIERTLLKMENRIYGKPTASTIFKVKNGNLSL